ncbi:hypothetical protein [Clostridium tetani]|nr:hypothetical protein [Clostridium tetani]
MSKLLYSPIVGIDLSSISISLANDEIYRRTFKIRYNLSDFDCLTLQMKK